MQSTIPLMSSASTRLADAGSAEAEGTLQVHAPWTSVRSGAFDVGKQDMSVSIALYALRMEKENGKFYFRLSSPFAHSFNVLTLGW